MLWNSFLLFSDTSVDLPYDGKNVHVSFIPNPSHLEVRTFFHCAHPSFLCICVSPVKDHVNLHNGQ